MTREKSINGSLNATTHPDGYAVPAADPMACKIVEANTKSELLRMVTLTRLMSCDESLGPRGLDGRE